MPDPCELVGTDLVQAVPLVIGPVPALVLTSASALAVHEPAGSPPA